MLYRLAFLLVLGSGCWWLSAQTVETGAVHTNATVLKGELVDAQNLPLASVEIELHSLNGPVLGRSITSGAGLFDFHVDAAGPFEFHVLRDGATQIIPVDDSNPASIVVKLASASAAPAAPPGTVSINDLQAPPHAKAKLDQANRAMAKLDLGRAWQLVNQAIAAAPNWGRAYFTRGVLSLENRNYGPAKSDLVTAVNDDPGDAAALTALGKLYIATGDLDLAQIYLGRALNIPPVLWPTYLESANLALQRSDFQRARELARDAEFSTPPAPPQVHFLLGQCAMGLQDFAAAAEEYRSFLALAAPSPTLEPALQMARQRLAALPPAAPH